MGHFGRNAIRNGRTTSPNHSIRRGKTGTSSPEDASQLEQINTAITLQDVLLFMANSEEIHDFDFSSDQWEFFAQVSLGLASAHECLRRS